MLANPHETLRTHQDNVTYKVATNSESLATSQLGNVAGNVPPEGGSICCERGAALTPPQESGDTEKQKFRQSLKAREWDELMAKKKLKVLQAVVRGCVWVGPEGAGPEADALLPFAVCLLEAPSEEPVSPETTAAAREQRNEQCDYDFDYFIVTDVLRWTELRVRRGYNEL